MDKASNRNKSLSIRDPVLIEVLIDVRADDTAPSLQPPDVALFTFVIPIGHARLWTIYGQFLS